MKYARRSTSFLLVSFILMLARSPGHAQGTREQVATSLAENSSISKKSRTVRRSAIDEMKKARRRLHLAHRHDAQQVRTMDKSERESLFKKLKKEESSLSKNRKKRASNYRENLQKIYGDKLEAPAVRTELVTHGWRIARLNRLLRIAKLTKDITSVKRAKLLLSFEKSAHQKRMKVLVAEQPSLSPSP